MGTLTVKGGTLSLVGGGGSQSPLERAKAALAARTTGPVRVAYLGSSTTLGNNATTAANRYVNRLAAAMQAAYPSGGTEPAVVASSNADFGTLSTANAVHAYNAGASGATAATYLAGDKLTKVAALNPRLAIHMVGSNEYATGVAVATYKASVQSALDALDAAITGTCIHVLVHSYQRIDPFTPVAAWSVYGQALAEIASARSNAVFVDLSGIYAAIGVPGADPANVVDSDNVHQTDSGHRLMAEALAQALRLPATVTPADTTAPTVPTNLTATPGDGQVALTWTASTDNTGVTGYKVYRGGTLIASPAGASYTDTGRTNGTQVSYTVSAVDAAGNESAQTTAVTATPAASGGAGTTIAADTFDRADTTASQTGLGTSSSGQTWTVPAGSSWQTASNKATGSGHAFLPAATDVDVSCTVSINGVTGAAGISLNAADSGNRITLYLNVATATTASWVFAKADGGTLTNFATSSGSPIDITTGTPHTLRVVSKGALITAYIDGTQVAQTTLAGADLTKYKALTLVGLRQSNAGAGLTFDNLSVVVPA